MEIVGKETALALLARHRERLFAQGPCCVMCALAQGHADVPFVAESEHAVVVLDRFGCRFGHLLVIPRAHVEALSRLDWQIFLEVQKLTFEAAQTLETCFQPARVFTASLGASMDLPMTYAHYHMHVIPVYETDERARPARVLSWSEGVVVYEDEEALRISTKLVEHWPSSGRAL